ncbi:hypothetical protein [Bradyrhizobium sp.]|uniref:hypothetical protein n=1 Tax=Bradyrhizobium sp. TaxID=376 RepID=UPI004037B78B
MKRYPSHRPSSAAHSSKAGAMAACVLLFGAVSLAQAEGVLKPDTVDKTRDMRFCEILVVKARGIEVYNTTGVSDCPAQLWNALDTAKLRRQFKALKVEKNGPHFWMMDSQTVSFGSKASFGGIDARWVARLPLLTALEAATGSKPYNVFNPKKTQRMVYAKGKPVYELVDPDRNVYVLQAHEEKFPADTLASLGEKLKLPSGWKFRSRDLKEDMILDLKSDQTIYAIGDEYHQYWTRVPNLKAN